MHTQTGVIPDDSWQTERNFFASYSSKAAAVHVSRAISHFTLFSLPLSLFLSHTHSLSQTKIKKERERLEQTFISSYSFVISFFSLLLRVEIVLPRARRTELTNRASPDDSHLILSKLLQFYQLLSFLWKKEKLQSVTLCNSEITEWLWMITWKVSEWCT